MPTHQHLADAKLVAISDRHYGARFDRVPFLCAADTLPLLQAGDVVVEYTPQLSAALDAFNESLLKGCMHLSNVVAFGDSEIYKMDMSQDRPYCDSCVFFDLMRREVHLKRYRIVLRHRQVSTDDRLREQINANLIRLAGFEDQEGTPVRVREVKGNMLMHIHRIWDAPPAELPEELYCTELTYLAYRLAGLEICGLLPLADLVQRAGGLPGRRETFKLARFYSLDAPATSLLYCLFLELERTLDLVKLSRLQPSRLLFKDGIWPHLVFENAAFEMVAIVPPERRYIEGYLKILESVQHRATRRRSV
jgi:hypothetical protein